MATSKFSEGIVLREFDYSESSKILKIFAREIGVIDVLVRGAKLKNSTLLSVSSTFSVAQYSFTKGRNFYYIDYAELSDFNSGLRRDFKKTVYASYMLELVEKTNPEEAKNIKTYELLKRCLKLLEISENPLLLILSFELKYISFMGYMPKLDQKLKFFSKAEGSVEIPDAFSTKVTLSDIYYLKKILYTSTDKNINCDGRERFLHNLILGYIKYNFEIENFNSLKLI